MTFDVCPLATVYGTQLLSSPNGGTLVCTVTGESLGQVRCRAHTNQGIFRTLAQRKRENIINLPTPYGLGTSVDGPRFLWQLSEGIA